MERKWTSEDAYVSPKYIFFVFCNTWRAFMLKYQILPTRINNSHWKLIYVSCTIPSSQYETNLWSTHVNIVWLAEPIRRCVRWRTQVFKIEGFVCKRFLPSPPPPPTFIFWLLFRFSLVQNRESRSSVFLCSEPKGKRLLRRLNRSQPNASTACSQRFFCLGIQTLFFVKTELKSSG